MHVCCLLDLLVSFTPLLTASSLSPAPPLGSPPLPRPAALVDLDAVDHNLDALTAALAPGPTLRLATKSIRHRGLIRYAREASE